MDSKQLRKGIGVVLGLSVVWVYSQWIAPHLGQNSSQKENSPQTETQQSKDGRSKDDRSDDGQAGDVKDHRKPIQKGAANGGSAQDRRLGRLERGTGEEWVSSAGLRYTPGSREGHRLDHVRRHDNDLPGRDGPHGVFDGDERQMLAYIDEAYQKVRSKDPNARVRREGDRTVCTVDMGRSVGFVGGRAGKSQGHPKTHHIRLVLEGDRLITAYPVVK